MRTVETTIDIDAPPADVWDVLVALEAYSEWNPFIPSVVGQLVVGESLELTVNVRPGRTVRFHPTVDVVDEYRMLQWSGHVGFPWLMRGTHGYSLEELPGGSTRFVNRETYAGWLVPIFWTRLEPQVRRGFEAMNEGLKDRVLSAG